MTHRIILKHPDGTVSIVVPAPECPLTIEEIALKDGQGLPYEIVDESVISPDRTFRNAWKYDAVKKIDIDMTKATDITHTRRRAKRATEFAPYDAIIAKQIPGDSAKQAEQARVAIRTKYYAMQVKIDVATTPETLKAIIYNEGL